MKRLTVILLLTTSWAYIQGKPSDLVQLKQREAVMRVLSDIAPVVITHHAPFRVRLEAIASRLRDTDWVQSRQELPAVPQSAVEAATALREAVHAPVFLITEFQGYYILSDVGLSEALGTLPLDSEPELRATLLRLLLSDPDAFMSGFAVPKNTAKWIKFDFRKTYTLTPKGVTISRNIIAEPKTQGDGLKPAP